MLRVPRYETTIAFLESRNCLGRGNHWPIAISRLGSAAELVSNCQAGDNEAGYKLSFCHAAILKQTSPARSIRKSEAKGGEHQRATEKYKTKATISAMPTIHQIVLSPAGFAWDPNSCRTKLS
jgi:hypothetical protein